MDALKQLKAEIAKKRKHLEESNLVDGSKKYFKRGDLVAKEEEEYRKKCGPIEGSSDIKAENVQTIKKDENKAETSADKTQILPRIEVVQRLRDRGEPIMLFGESEVDAFKRLRKWEISEPEMDKGFRNDFQEAMESVDQAYLDELLATGGIPQESDTASDSKDQSSNLGYEEIQKLSKAMGRGNRDLDMMVILSFLEYLLKLWNEQLNKQSSDEKIRFCGKMARATYAQTQVYLKPLLRKLKNHTLPEDISDSLTDIVKHLLNRSYITASAAYLQMAIGNAPWPIGVTMVGIHPRTGREKIFSKNVAHVMNDETQRKYIQALKRLMTKCQEYFPTDPSRCVEYAAFGPS